jgi:hypothetical protein
VCKEGHLLVPGFFRPVGDLTLKWTWQLFGFQPFYFFLGNALLHSVNSWMLFLVCRRIYVDRENALWFACIASAIFFSYHSHGEAILWSIGRGISLATFFALLAMAIFVSRIHEGWKVLLVSLCYFIALACYESAALLPVVLWFISRSRPVERSFRKWWVALSIALLASVILREIYSGGVWMAYKGSIFWKDAASYVSDTVKIILRVFTPSFNKPLLFATVGSVVIGAVALFIFLRRKKMLADAASRNMLMVALGGLLCSLPVAMVFSISTRTTEGDRLLYFPACFFAMLIALLLMQFRALTARWLVFLGIIVIQITFLLQTRNNWMRASAYAKQVIKKISAEKSGPLYIINMPEEIKGAYIFRNCLLEALPFYGVDAHDVHVVNRIGYVEAQQKEGPIVPEGNKDSILIWPQTAIIHRGDSVIAIKGSRTAIAPRDASLRSILFWNKEELRSLR